MLRTYNVTWLTAQGTGNDSIDPYEHDASIMQALSVFGMQF